MTNQLAPGEGFEVDLFPSLAGFTEFALLSVLDRVFPEWYLDTLKSPGPGYEWYQAVAAMLARASNAIFNTERSMFVVFSHGGARAEADVEFFRADTVTGAFTIKAGTIVRTSKTNRSYELISDAFMPEDELSVEARVRAVAPAAEYNVEGPTVTADGTTLPGEIDLVAIPILDPVLAEPAIQVRQLATAEGGLAAVLDQLGLDKDLPRLIGESDPVYKGRIRQLPDTVSPAALKRQLDAIFLPMDLSYQLIETWQNEYQTCYDFPEGDLVHPMMGVARADCFAFDDPRTDPFRGRLLDERDFISGLVVVVPEVGAWSERSLAYDDDDTVGPSSTFASLIVLDFEEFGSAIHTPVATNTAPWSAVFVPLLPGGAANATIVRDPVTDDFIEFAPGIGIAATFIPGATLIEVRDHQRFDIGTASWVSEPSCVGILVRSNSSVLVSSIENAVNASSLLVRCSVPDSSPGKAVTSVFIGSSKALVVPMGDGLSSNVTARGWRARSALDAPDRDGDPSVGSFLRVPFLDGYDLLHDQFYKRLSDLLHPVKGGGTNSAIEL